MQVDRNNRQFRGEEGGSQERREGQSQFRGNPYTRIIASQLRKVLFLTSGPFKCHWGPVISIGANATNCRTLAMMSVIFLPCVDLANQDHTDEFCNFDR